MGRHALDEVFSCLYSVPVPKVLPFNMDPGAASIVSTPVSDEIIGRLVNPFKEILDPGLFVVPARGLIRQGMRELRACLRRGGRVQKNGGGVSDFSIVQPDPRRRIKTKSQETIGSEIERFEGARGDERFESGRAFRKTRLGHQEVGNE